MEEGLSMQNPAEAAQALEAGEQAKTPEPAGTEAPQTADFCGEVRRIFQEKPVDLRTYSPLALAFLGDGIYSAVVRTMVISRGNRQAKKLHDETRHLVSAGAQARIGDAVQELLTEEEQRIYHRGRNANPPHHAKSASYEEYMKATALETLCGYLYLKGETERFLEILKAGIEGAGL